MKTLKDLTPEIRAKIPKYKQRVRDTYQMGFDRHSSKMYVDEIYAICGREKPKVFFASNRYVYAMLFLLLNKIKHNELDTDLFNELRNELHTELYTELDTELGNELGNELNTELDTELGNELFTELYIELRNVKSYWLSLCSSYQKAYLTWYQFISKEFNINHKSKATLDKLYHLSLKSSIGRCYFTEKYVIVLREPKTKFLNSRLHCEDGPAVDYGLIKNYYWKGVRVDKKLITAPETITANDLKTWSDNAEVRRCCIEKMGVKRYYDLLSGGNGLTEIDTDIDKQGNPMTLYEFVFEGVNIQVLECVDPSTGRTYNIYPPTQKSGNVWDAKADTFSQEKLHSRQGDVGIVKIGYDGPTLIET